MLRSIGFLIALLSGVANAVEVKPEINGTFESACRAAGTANCALGLGSSAVPQGIYAASIQISDQSFVTVQDLIIKDSAANAININRSTGVVVDNLTVDAIAFSGLAAQTNNVNLEIRNNTFSRMAWCEKWEQDGETNANSAYEIGICFSGGQPYCVGITGSRGSYSVIENNIVDRGRCEGLNTFGSSYIAVFANRVVGTGLGLHLDKTRFSVVLRNIFLGSNDTWASNNGQSGIDLALENNQGDGDRNVIAANIIAGGVESGIKFDNIADAALDAGYNTGAYIYGNTLVANASNAFWLRKNDDRAYDYVGIVNNLIYTTQGNDCAVSAAVTDQLDLNQYNGWSTGGPDSSTCSDATDQTGSSPFPQTEAWYIALDETDVATIAYNDFRLPSGASNFKANGSLPVSVPTWVTDTLGAAGWSDITIEGGGISACGSGMPANLNADADCVTRSAVNMGALETTL